MTRINIGINPKLLSNQHLLAEHREIKRIPNTIRSGKAKLIDIPNSFRLGVGHCKFFYDKQLYLFKRYLSIYKECINRGFNVQDYSTAWDNLPKQCWNDYKPNKNDLEIIMGRLLEKDNKFYSKLKY